MTLAAAALTQGGCSPDNDAKTLDAFEANLASHASATQALRLWCEQRGIAKDATIRVEFQPGKDAAEPADLRQLLALGQDEQPGYRHVRLICGDVVLSEAHNWYVPARLTPAMNAELASTDHPFGKVAGALNFSREPLASARSGDPACPAGAISTHRALLRLPNGQPLALVAECYTEANLR